MTSGRATPTGLVVRGSHRGPHRPAYVQDHPREVESAIDQHPDVVASAVVAAPDAEEGQVPVAFVVLREGRELSAEDLMWFLRERIAEYKLPSRTHFLDALPLTASGKIAPDDLHGWVRSASSA